MPHQPRRSEHTSDRHTSDQSCPLMHAGLRGMTVPSVPGNGAHSLLVPRVESESAVGAIIDSVAGSANAWHVQTLQQRIALLRKLKARTTRACVSLGTATAKVWLVLNWHVGVPRRFSALVRSCALPTRPAHSGNAIACSCIHAYASKSTLCAKAIRGAAFHLHRSIMVIAWAHPRTQSQRMQPGICLELACDQVT